MAATRAVTESRGFTTDIFGRCSLCKAEIPECHLMCECGAMILQVKLQPKQREILDFVLREGRDVPTKALYGGSRAAGKSRMCRDVALVVVSEIAQKYPGIPVFMIRRNWTQCKETFLEKFKIERPELNMYYTDKQYVFPPAMNNSRIVFQYADTPDDVERMERGPECFLMVCDQGEQLSELDLQRLNSPNRWPDAGPGAAKTIYSSNPGGPGSQYLKRVFIDKAYKDNENPNDFVFQQAYGHDNFSWFKNEGIEIDGQPLSWDRFYELPGDIPPLEDGERYDAAWLARIPDTNRFKMYVTQTSEGRKHWAKPESLRMGDLFGRFDSFSGQYFANWDEKRVVLR